MTLRIPLAVLPLSVGAIFACADPSGPPDQALAAMMLGEWTHSRAPSIPPAAPALSAGFFVSITIDSARGSRFWGHVGQWFVGDVGLPANGFGPVTGSLDSAYGVVLQVASGGANGLAVLQIEGQIDGDVLTVRASWMGPEPGPFPSGCRFQRLH